MNIFFTSFDPVQAAQWLPNRLVVKMVVESAQMLSTATRLLGEWSVFNEITIYKTAQPNHPCNVWVRECSENYWWLFNHYLALGTEYTYRYHKAHKSMRLAGLLCECPAGIPFSKELTKPVQAMPDKYRAERVEIAYRRYCIDEKTINADGKEAVWTRRERPYWWPTKSSQEDTERFLNELACKQKERAEKEGLNT